MIIARGERPFWWSVSPTYAAECGVDRMPGIVVDDRGVWCARDAAEVVGLALGSPADPNMLAAWDTIDVARDWPGWERFSTRFLPRMRAYQPLGSYYLAARSAAFECDFMRSGKNFATLGACALVGARKTLVTTLGTPKLGWAEDIAKWAGDWALMLDGRAGTDAWWFCAACAGKGYIRTAPASAPDAKDLGASILGASSATERCDTCRGRGWIRAKKPEEALERARITVANYDILIGQKAETLAGVVRMRGDLPGWAPKIARHFVPDTAILDEAHVIGKRGGRRSSLRWLIKNVSRVYAPTGTPYDGQVASLYYPLDLVTGGVWGRSYKLFAARFAGGHDGDYGFVTPKRGKTYLADVELPERIKHLMIRRTKKDVAPHLPSCDMQVVRIARKDHRASGGADGSVVVASGGDAYQLQGGTEAAIERALDTTAPVKVPDVVEMILGQLREGSRIASFSRFVGIGHRIASEVRHAIESRRAGALYGVPVWDCIGKSYERRVEMADAFSAHQGAAMFNATIDGFQMGRSLLGLDYSHFPDLHWDPTKIQQCGARGDVYERTTPLIWIFYLLEHSADDHVLSVVVPKLESLEAVLGDKDASRMREFISPRETADEIWARHTAHLRAVA